MNKPLGYYTGYIPINDSYLDQLQEQYGVYLQNLTRREQLFLINLIASYLCCCEPGDIRGEVVTASHNIQCRVNNSDKEGLIEALINQIRWGNHGETIT